VVFNPIAARRSRKGHQAEPLRDAPDKVLSKTAISTVPLMSREPPTAQERTEEIRGPGKRSNTWRCYLMKRHAVCFLALSSALIIISSRAEAFKCLICHSKNPAMVKMHDAIRAKKIGCFDCHRVGDKLMGKGRRKDRELLLQRKRSEMACIQCHQADGRGEPTAPVPAKPE